MSGDVDPDDKTEEPTEKRLHDAMERGEVAFSREAPLFASLGAILVALIFVIPGRAETLLSALVGVIDDPAGWRIERGEDVLALAGPVVIAGARFLLPTVILLTAAGVLASVAQGTPRIAPQRIMPDASRISPRNGSEPDVRPPRLDGIPEEPDQTHGGRHGRDDDAGGSEGRPAHGDGQRSGDAAAEGARPLRQGDRGCAGRDAGGGRRRSRLVADALAAGPSHEQAGSSRRSSDRPRATECSKPGCARFVSTARANACCPPCRARRWSWSTPPITRSRCDMSAPRAARRW